VVDCCYRTGEQVRLLIAENASLMKLVNELKQKELRQSTIVHEAENWLLQATAEVQRLRELLNSSQKSDVIFSFSKISHDNKLVEHFTGLPNKETFFALLKLCDGLEIQYLYGWKVSKLTRENQLFLTLLKLRRNLSHIDLSVRFAMSETAVANVFVSWLILLHYILVDDLLSTVPSREKNQEHLPASFKGYEDTRIVIDATEITTANPALMDKQKRMFSNYKHKITSKGLVGISPNGNVTFASKLYAGSTSDRNVVIHSGLLNCLVPGDAVMAGKGFNIEDLLPDGVKLYIPPFKDAPQFTSDQVQETFGVARARIHVERAINRIKRFGILSFIPQSCAPYASEIFQVCASLTNFQAPLLKSHEDDEE